MEPRQVKTAADALKIVKERGLMHVKVGVHDVDGILRGKYVHLDKFKSALDGGMGFCDVVLGWDTYISSTTTSPSPAGTPATPTPTCASCPTPAARSPPSPAT